MNSRKVAKIVLVIVFIALLAMPLRDEASGRAP